MDDKITIFTAVTAFALLLQILILLLMGLRMLKLSRRVEGLADKIDAAVDILRIHALPVVNDAKSLSLEGQDFVRVNRPKIESLINKVTDVATETRATIHHLNATSVETRRRIQVQVIRRDRLLEQTRVSIEEMAERVQHTVLAPMRRAFGLALAIKRGVATYMIAQTADRSNRI
jgi:methyl-accepting chemotaxis protein